MGIIKYDWLHRVYACSQFRDEVISCTKGYGSLKKFQKWLNSSLMQLDDEEFDFLHAYPRFENIETNIYAMRFKGEKNIRILFSAVKNMRGSKIVLLHIFIEKNKSDYNNAKPVARRRLREMKREVF